MKTIYNIKNITSLFVVIAASILNSTFASEKSIQEVEKTYIKIGVDGMACPFCAYGLEKKIKKIEGSENFYVDINEGFITFEVPIDKKPSEADLLKLVKEAGFKIRKIDYSKVPFKVEKNE